MPFCVNCGNENPVGIRFCSKCGTEQVATLMGCSNCGKTLEENEKFCSDCGTSSTSTVEPKTESKPKKDNLTPEGRKIISGGPKPDQVKSQPTSPPPVTPTAQKKKKGCMGCMGKSLIGVFILLIVGVVIIWNLPEDEENIVSDTNIPGIVDIEPRDVKSETGWNSDENLGLEIPVKFKGKPVSKELQTVSEENPVATFKKVIIDFEVLPFTIVPE